MRVQTLILALAVTGRYTAENITLPSAKNLLFVLELVRQDIYLSHFGCINYFDDEHGWFNQQREIPAFLGRTEKSQTR